MQALIPEIKEHLGGPFRTVGEKGFTVLASRENTYIIEFHSLPEGVAWPEEFVNMYSQKQHDGESLKVIREATDEEIKRFRIPVWVQDDDVPECCGKPMFFVGQIDDDTLCAERPKHAKMWWHDAASFYVFTCPKCLSCEAVGQQY